MIRIAELGKNVGLAMTLTAILILGFGQAEAEDEHHHHGNQHQAGKKSKLSLNKGKKWATDKVLRNRMHDIHQLVEQNLERIHKGEMDDKEFQSMGSSIEDSINDIFKNCKLAPDADAQLHLILAKMITAKDQLKKAKATKKERHSAVEGILGGIKNYHRYFDEGSPKS